MLMRTLNFLLLVVFIFCFEICYAQQDMDLHITCKFLAGKNILKVKRDFYDPYLWVLAQNNEVYRINSLTQVVENYTVKFNAYNHLEFIDIAGASEDIVFIATNSNNVIQLKNGVLKNIGAAEGIVTKVNSVGVLKKDWQNLSLLRICSDNGLYTYDIPTEKIIESEPRSVSKVYEATYRSTVYKDSMATYPDWNGRKYVPVMIKGDLTMFRYFFFENDVTGSNINTGYMSFGTLYNADGLGSYSGLFWGTNNGMFQVNGDRSYFMDRPYGHYLEGIKVNKITTIYGLTSFGDGSTLFYPGLIQENMLIGTDKGLYFSKSIYWSFDPTGQGQRQVELFHFDDLGTKTINDINVNARSTVIPYCEDGAWVAANDGLYFLTQSYQPTNVEGDKQIAILVDGQPNKLKELEICENTTVKVGLPLSQNLNLNVTWFKNNSPITGEIDLTLKINAAGDYYAALHDACANVWIETPHLKVNVITAPTVTFNYPDKISQCQGTTTTLQVNANNNYSYRWYKNGVLNGNSTATLNTAESGKYKVEVSSCSGTWVSTKEVEVNFITVPVPALVANKTAYCIGQVATLSTSFVNDGSYTINWFRDGNLLSAEQNKTSINTMLAGSYTIKLNSNLVHCDNTSTPVTLAFESMPTINLERIITTTLCDGQTVDVKATYSGGTVKWNTGAATDKITVNRSGLYIATIKTAAGCEVSENIDIHFFTNPTLNLLDATLCQFINESITLTAPAGFAKYEWNGQIGEANFSTNKLGAVNLKVTDNNGCTATQTINVTSQCDEIHVPNTFTPNNDGYNDTWKIEGLEGDPSITIRVFNRAGEMVFRSVAYSTPWDGTYKGKKLPAGTYYYIINAKKGGQALNGGVTIIN